MSLLVTMFVPSGIVMAADSRLTSTHTAEQGEGDQKVRIQQQVVLTDNAYKIVDLKSVQVGIAAYDAIVIDNQPIESHIRRFEEGALSAGDDVHAVAEKFLNYLESNHPGVSIGFHVAGYATSDRISMPHVLAAHTIHEKAIRRINVNPEGQLQYGVLRSGDVLVANRLIDPNFQPIFAAMPLQDAIDYTIHLIRATIDTLRFEPRYPSVGGPIDVLVLKPDGMQWVQRKELRGEG